MKSLMIVGLPKSATTVCYQVCARGLKDLRVDARVAKHGEVFSLMEDGTRAMYLERNELGVARHLLQWSEDYVVKDVLATAAIPLVADDFNILYLERPLADILYLRRARSQWCWELGQEGFMNYETLVGSAATVVQDNAEALVDAMIVARTKLRRSARAVITYDQFITDPNYLWKALEDLRYRVHKTQYQGKEFVKVKQKRLQVRKTKEWKDAQALVRSRML